MSTTTLKPRYKVTGVDRYGKRFRITTNSSFYCSGINLWRGSKWELDETTNKYKLLVRVFN